MKPIRILLCWELGGGSGHLEILGTLARRYQDKGHEVFLAARDVITARRYGPTRHLRVLSAPFHGGSSGGLTPALSYGELLTRCGYSNVLALRALLGSWLQLMDVIRPELVITEHSPTAIIASNIAGIPVAATGPGFMAPPDQFPIPAFLPDKNNVTHRLHTIELQAVAAINQALLEFDIPCLTALSGLFPKQHVFLSTYAEMDHYGERDGVRYWGTPDQRSVGDTPAWPRGRGEKVFAYMHPGYPHFKVMIEQLGQLGHPTLVVAPGISADQVRLYSRPHLRIQNDHVNLDEVAERCRVVICHGGHGTLARILRRGVPPIVVPNFVEQTMSAKRLGLQKLVFAAHPDPRRHDYDTMIQAAIDSDIHHRTANDFAIRYPVEQSGATVAQMADEILQLAEQKCITWPARDAAPTIKSSLVISRALYGESPEESGKLARRCQLEIPYLGKNENEYEWLRGQLAKSEEPQQESLNQANYLGFIGFPRSGHSLFGAMLDAHPEVIVSHELDTVRLLMSDFSQFEIRRLIAENSALAARIQRRWGPYTHAVPGQYQGCWRELKYIGDKQGGRTARALHQHPQRLEKLLHEFGRNQHFFFAIRNPLDNIVRLARDTQDGKIETAAALYFKLCAACQFIINRIDSSRVFFLYQEKFIGNPAEELIRACEFLGLAAEPEYLEACTKVVYPTPNRRRGEIEWPYGLPDRIAAKAKMYPFLQPYLAELPRT